MLTSAASGVPRYDYNPVTGALNGLLIEPQSTNILVGSSTPGGSGWSNTGSYASGTTGTENVFGYSTGVYYHRRANANGTEGFQQGYTFTNGTVYTLSCYVRIPAGLTPSDLFFYGGSTSIQIATQAQLAALIPGTWNRFSVTFTASSTTTTYNQVPFVSDPYPVGTGWDLAFPQLEALPNATSYIPTSGSAVTRAADLLTGSPVWLNGSQGTVLCSYIPQTISNSNGVFALGSSSTNYIDYRTGGQGQIDANGTSNNQTGAAATVSLINSVAMSYSPLGVAYSVNQGIPTTTSTAAPTGLTSFYLGSAYNGSQGALWLQSVKYWSYPIINLAGVR